MLPNFTYFFSVSTYRDEYKTQLESLIIIYRETINSLDSYDMVISTLLLAYDE